MGVGTRAHGGPGAGRVVGCVLVGLAAVGAGKPHVLLPALMLLRRADWADTIGRAIERRARGWSHRRIGRELGVPQSTARSWLSRFAELAEAMRAHFTRWVIWLDPGRSRISPSGSPLVDAVMAILTRPKRRGLASVPRASH